VNCLVTASPSPSSYLCSTLASLPFSPSLFPLPPSFLATLSPLLAPLLTPSSCLLLPEVSSSCTSLLHLLLTTGTCQGPRHLLQEVQELLVSLGCQARVPTSLEGATSHPHVKGETKVEEVVEEKPEEQEQLQKREEEIESAVKSEPEGLIDELMNENISHVEENDNNSQDEDIDNITVVTVSEGSLCSQEDPLVDFKEEYDEQEHSQDKKDIKEAKKEQETEEEGNLEIEDKDDAEELPLKLQLLHKAKSKLEKKLSKTIRSSAIRPQNTGMKTEHWTEYKDRKSKGTELLSCKFCDFRTLSKGHVTRHMKAKHGVDPPTVFSCNECDYTSSQPGHIQRHQRAKHEGVKFPCKLCSLTFTIKHCLTRHIERVHQGTKYPCPHCHFKASSVSALKYHMQWKHRNFKLTCDICGHEVNTEKNLRRHKAVVHEGQWHNCTEPECDYKAKDSSTLRFHIQVTHEGARIECKHCGKIYTKITTLKSHMATKHAGEET